MRGTHRFGVKGKLAPRYIGPFRILARRGLVAYQLELPPQFSHVHDVFHVSQLRRCFKDPEHEVDPELIEVQDDLTYKEHQYKKYTSVVIRVCHSKSRFLSCMYIHDDFMT